MEETLAKINKGALKFLVPLTPKDTYKVIVEEAKKIFKAVDGSIFIKQNNNLVRMYASNPLYYKVNIRRKANTYSSYKNRKVIIAYRRETQQAHPVLKSTDIQTFVFIPLSYQKKSHGVLSLYMKERIEYDRRERDMLSLFGSMASLAIRKTQLYDETKKALELRDIFISMAAHELRTPLTSINGYIQLLHRKVAGKNDSISHWTEQLYSESLRMTNLVNELLENNRIRSGKAVYIFEECHILEIVQKSIDTFNLMHQDKKFILNSSIDASKDLIVGDGNKLVQVFDSLIDNAVKFSPPESPIKINVGETKSQFVIEIIDQGKGIKQNVLSNIFEGYFSIEENPQGGMGLGLFIANSTIKAHHGKLEILSKTNKGTTIRIHIPKMQV